MSKKNTVLVESREVTIDFEPTAGQNTLLINSPGTVLATVSTTSDYVLTNVQLKKEDIRVYYNKTKDVSSTFAVSIAGGASTLTFSKVTKSAPATQSFYLTPLGPPNGTATDYVGTNAITLGISATSLTYDVSGEEGGVATSPNPWTLSTR